MQEVSPWRKAGINTLKPNYLCFFGEHLLSIYIWYVKENFIKLVGALWWIIYFIYCLLDDSTVTPKEAIWGLRSYDDWYYLVIIIEYVLFLPLWMWIYNHTFGPFLSGALTTIFSWFDNWKTSFAGVVTTRAHVHYVVTEYGVAHLYSKTIEERVKLLINIALPAHREDLMIKSKMILA